ncbi:unnamed protein product, partial [Allacma fusca]
LPSPAEAWLETPRFPLQFPSSLRRGHYSRSSLSATQPTTFLEYPSPAVLHSTLSQLLTISSDKLSA